MKRYEEFIAGLQQDTDVPDAVWTQYLNTLENIEQLSEERKEGRYMGKNQRGMGRTLVKAAAVAGVLVAGTAIFSYADPVAASKLPLIGRVFEQVAQDATYSGDYEKKTVLKEGQVNGAADGQTDTKKAEESLYTATDGSITITASEVYSDGYSVYLAAKIESENGGFSKIPSHYTRRFENKTSKAIHVQGMWKTDMDGEETSISGGAFEGKAVDDHTFIGMMKLDQNQYSVKDGQLQLELSEFLYDDETAMNTDEIEPQNRIKGSWKLNVPFSVDQEQCKEIPIKKSNESGFSLQKVFVSPYQVIVFTDTPYTTLSPDTYTREDFEEQWGIKNEEILANDEEAFTYEDMLAQKIYDYYEVAVYSQDGESLEMQYGGPEKTVFAVQDHELSKLHIYAGDESHEMKLIKAADEQAAKEVSVLDAQVDIQ